MSNKKTIFTFIIIISNTLSFNSIGQLNYNDEQMIKTLTVFYSEYITECSTNMDNEDEMNKIKATYCTQHILKKIERQKLDYDPFLNAQDCDIRWIKYLTITKDLTRKNCFSIGYGSEYVVTVILKRKKDKYRIADIIE